MIDQPVANRLLARAEIRANFAVLDVETTGLNPRETRMIEIAIVEIDANGRILDEFDSLINIPGDGPLGAEFIHHVTREMLVDAPEFIEIVDHVAGMLQGRIVVGHVIAFDLGYLIEEYHRAGQELPTLIGATLCTRDLARAALPPGPKSLQACCDAFGIVNEAAHTALGDARATADLLVKLLAGDGLFDLDELSRGASAISWPARARIQQRIAKPRARLFDDV
jgi:DNA polymerase-3 subunit epsilon